MKPFHHALLALGLFGLFGTSATAADTAGTATIDNQYAHSVWNWDKMGEAHIFWTLYSTDGFLTVCGGYATRGPSATRKFTRIALRDTAIYMNGKSIITNLNWLSTLVNGGSELDFVGQSVKCMATTTPTPTKDTDVEFELRSRKDAYRG